MLSSAKVKTLQSRPMFRAKNTSGSAFELPYLHCRVRSGGNCASELISILTTRFFECARRRFCD